MVRIYHVLNWFFVLLLFTVSVAYWTYFKVKQEVYINDCQDFQNIKNNITGNPYYTQISIPGKQLIAPGSDKSYCINLVKHFVIASGISTFVFNFIQVLAFNYISIYIWLTVIIDLLGSLHWKICNIIETTLSASTIRS